MRNNKNTFQSKMLSRTNSFAETAGPVTLLLYDLEKKRGYTTNFRIQKQLWKKFPVFPKNP